MNLTEIYKQLSRQYGNNNGEMVFTFSDKGAAHSYIEFYENYFKTKRDCVTLLEIGMMTGGSMHLWQKYFTKYTLVGLDLAPTWNQLRPFQIEVEQDPNITLIFNCDSRSPDMPSAIFDKEFNFVIDDGDHSVSAQIDTFTNYWPVVQDKGVYFIEDVIGSEQVVTLTKFIKEHCAELGDAAVLDHYVGHKNGRLDDQILAVKKIKNGNNK